MTENINIFPLIFIGTISSKTNELKFVPYYNFMYKNCTEDNIRG